VSGQKRATTHPGRRRSLRRGRRRFGGNGRLGQAPGGLGAVLAEEVDSTLAVVGTKKLQHRDGGHSTEFGVVEDAFAFKPHFWEKQAVKKKELEEDVSFRRSV